MNRLSQVTTDFAISVHGSRWERQPAGLYFHLRTEQNMGRCYWSSGDCVGPRCHQGVAPEVADLLSNYTHVAYKQDALCPTLSHSLAPCSQLLCELENRNHSVSLCSLFQCRQQHLNLQLSCLERHQLNTVMSLQCHQSCGPFLFLGCPFS